MRVWDCTFENTDIGIRLKAERGQGGVVEDIIYESLTMKNVASPAAAAIIRPRRRMSRL